MAPLKFTNSHNMVAFLEKPTECDGFELIVNFLNANPIKYALTVNPTIYTSCIEQFWATAKVKTVNGEGHIQALLDGKKVVITESTIRRDLHLEDAEGTDCLPNATFFEELTRMGQMHNNIMATGSRDRPPMLATGRYAQWRSHFLRYIDTKTNGDALRKCILEGPYISSTVVIQVVPATENSPAVPEHITVETILNMSPANKAHFESEKEAIHMILTGIGDEKELR
ncbi:hypothetical protein Tco_0408653 [Tanacetum coccineum]